MKIVVDLCAHKCNCIHSTRSTKKSTLKKVTSYIPLGYKLKHQMASFYVSIHTLLLLHDNIENENCCRFVCTYPI